jgi:hypothetical protein
MDIAKEFANAGIDDSDLLERIQERMETRDRACPPKTRSELELLCYIFFDLTARGPVPMFPTLDSFLSRYHQESLTTVEVITTIQHTGTSCSEPDFPLRDLELMPKKALEYLELVNPPMREEPFCDRVDEIRPTKRSISDRKWPKQPRSGRWAAVVDEADEGESYRCFLDYYTDKDRDARVLDMWHLRNGKPEEEEDEERPHKRPRKE